MTAQRGAKRLDVHETETITLANGKITRVDEQPSDQAAKDDFWS